MPSKTHQPLQDEEDGPINYSRIEETSSLYAFEVESSTSLTPSRITDPIPVKRSKIFTILNLVAVLLFLAVNYLYIDSSQHCPYDNETTCATDFIQPRFRRWGLQIAIAAFIFTAIIYMGKRRTLPRFFLYLAIINIFYLIALFNPVLTAQDYGLLIAFFLVFFMIVWFIFLGFILLLQRCWRKSKWIFVCVFLLIVSPGLSFYFMRVKGSCDDWTKGLGGEAIINDGETCSVEIPETCVYEVSSGLLDFSRYNSCPNSKPNPSTMEKYFSGAPVIGFPRTEKFSQKERQTPQKYILENTVLLTDMNDPAGKDLEVFLDMTVKDDPKLKIEIKKNLPLIEERAKINSDSLAKNVLVIYIDALSRVNSLRKLKKTMAWFEKYINQQDIDSETFQFFKYHAVTPHTYQNLFESFFGMQDDDPRLEYGTKTPSSFIQDFQNNGYITAHSSDLCQLTPLEFHWPPVQDLPYDHEALSMACDPNFFFPGNPLGIDHGPYSSLRRCLYKRDVFEYLYEFGNKFWTTYEDQKKFLYLEFLDAHEFTGEHVKNMDDALSSFLGNLQNEGRLEDTAVILYADHGLHINIPLELAGFRQVEIEKYLPALYMRLPREMSEKYRSDIKANQQSIVSAHQLHNFFLTLAHGETSPVLADSIIGPLTKQRSCADIKTRDKCMCRFDANGSM